MYADRTRPGQQDGKHSAGRHIKRIWCTCMSAFFPAVCTACRQLYRIDTDTGKDAANLNDAFQMEMTAHLCVKCRRDFVAVDSPLCPKCGIPFVSPHGLDHVCEACLKQPYQFQAARSFGRYEGALRSVIQQFKFSDTVQLSGPLGRLLWQTFLRNWLPTDFDHVVPVPLHPSRLRQRSYNQAYLLVRHWPGMATQSGTRLPSNWIDGGTLVRLRRTRPQSGLKREQRARNMHNTFAVESSRCVQGKRYLLVDDVMTTGATADACAHTLINAGAAMVQVLTLARVC